MKVGRPAALTVVGGLIAMFGAAGGVVGLAPAQAAGTSNGPAYSLADVGGYGGEPSITVNSHGELYDTTPSGGTVIYASKDFGATWQQLATADTSSGDDCDFTDQSNALYECNLAGSQSTGPLQADVWKSVDDGKTWMYGNNNVNTSAGSNVCGTSCSPFGVDRDWADAYIPAAAGGDTSKALVALMYHDFYGPSQIWVNISTDGGKDFGPPQNVLANFVQSQNAAVQDAVAQADSACNTFPRGCG